MTKTTEKTPAKPELAAKANKTEVIESTERRISELVDGGLLHVAPDYSAANALRAAYLILQETVDKNSKPVLEVCTRASIANALLKMVVLGIDPNRNQGYFIARGPRLTFQVSYFGNLALARRLSAVKDAWAAVIYEGDDFEFELVRGQKRVLKHKQTLESIAKGKIIGAYAVAEFTDDRPEEADILSWIEIQAAWKKGNSTAQKDFPWEMAKRTALNRLLKRHINSSNDKHLGLIQTFLNRYEAEDAADEVEVEARERGNREVLSLEDDRTIEVDTATEADEQMPPPTQESGELFGADDAPY